MAEDDTDRATTTRIRQLEKLDGLAKTFGRSLSTALSGSLGSGRQLDSLLGSLGGKLAGAAVKAALKPVEGGVTSLVNQLLSSSATAFARGGVVEGSRVRPFAEGGIVAAPTYFPMRGGTGLMGEAGPEAILPLRRGPDGRLGVAGGASARPVSVNVTIATPDPGAFRRSEAQVAAQLARAVARGQRAL